MVGGARGADSGFRVQGSGFRVQGSGFRVQSSEFRGADLIHRTEILHNLSDHPEESARPGWDGSSGILWEA